MPQTYSIAYEGPISLANLEFREVALPPLPQPVVDVVEEKWQGVLAKNPSAFPGPILSIREITPREEKLEIAYAMTDYKHFMATAFPAIRAEHGKDAVHTATAICVVIMDKGGKNILLHLRGRDMAYRRFFHVPGGMLSEPDPQKAIRKEIEEEIGISFEECPPPTLLGIACDLNPGRMNHEFCFQVEVPLEFSEIRKRHAKATSKNEGILIPVPNEQETIEAFLELGDEKALDVWVPTGHAAVVLHGRSMRWWQDTGGFPKLIQA